MLLHLAHSPHQSWLMKKSCVITYIYLFLFFLLLNNMFFPHWTTCRTSLENCWKIRQFKLHLVWSSWTFQAVGQVWSAHDCLPLQAVSLFSFDFQSFYWQPASDVAPGSTAQPLTHLVAISTSTRQYASAKVKNQKIPHFGSVWNHRDWGLGQKRGKPFFKGFLQSDRCKFDQTI